MSQKRIIHAKDTSSSHLNQYRDLELDNGSLKVKGSFDSDINDSLNNIETELQSVDNRLDQCIGHTNNTTAVGEGSNQLRVVPLGYDRTNGVARSLLVDANGKLEVNNSDIELNTDGLETLIGATNTTLGLAEAHLGTIDTNIGNAEAHLGNIDTGVDVLEACCGSNKVNVNISSGGITGFATETTLNNAEVHLGTIDTNIANAEAHLGTIDTNIANAEAHLGNIDTYQSTIVGHLDGVETLITSTNSKIDTFDAVLDASLVKQTNIETKLGEIDSVLDNIKVDTEAIETAVETLDDIVLSEDTAHNTGDKGVMTLAVRQSTQADFGADGDYVPLSINDDGELRVTSGSSSSTTGEFLATGTTLGSYTLSSALDVSAYKNVRLMGKESGGSVSSIPVYGSQTSGGTYYGLSNTDWLNQASVNESGSGSTFFMSANIENTPKFLKIFNNTGSSFTIELDYVAHK